MILLILAITIPLFYFSKAVAKHQKLLQLIVQEIPTFFGYIDEYRRLAKEGNVSECELEPVKFVTTEIKNLMTLLGYVISGKTEEFIKSLVKTYAESPAEFKKLATEQFYDLLRDYSGLAENKVYQLTYIFNRFIGDFIEKPKRAVLHLVFRFYKYLREFGYL